MSITINEFVKYMQIFHLRAGGGGGGDGDVRGPSFSNDNALVRFHGSTGKLIQNSAASLDDGGNMVVYGLEVTSLFQIINYTPKLRQLSVDGTDVYGDGSYWRPNKSFAFLNGQPGNSTMLGSPGTYKEENVVTKLAPWLGYGKDITVISIPEVTLNQTEWSAATVPQKIFQNLNIANTQGGELLAINVDTPGTGYADEGTVSVDLTGGGFITPGTAEAVVGYGVESISIISPGLYLGIPSIVFPSGVGATFTVRMGVNTVSIVNGGFGYGTGDKIVVKGGVSRTVGVLQVDTIAPGGVITGLSPTVEYGEYSVLPSNPVSDTTFYPNCFVATTGDLTAIYDNGVLGVGATLTNAGVVVPFFADGEDVPFDGIVLVKDQIDLVSNGIYRVKIIGLFGEPWVLERVTYFDEPIELQQYGKILITNGDLNANTIWEMTSVRPVEIGPSPIVFAEFFGRNATFNITSWRLTDIEVTAEGSGYESDSPINVVGGGGSGGDITYTLDLPTGAIKSITITDPGSGYSSAPAVAITGGDGTGATATAVVAAIDGVIDLRATTFKSGSSQIFRDFKTGSAVRIANIDLGEIANSEIFNLEVSGTRKAYISNSRIPTVTINNDTTYAATDNIIEITNCETTTININTSGRNVSLYLRGIKGLQDVFVTDGTYSEISIYIDALSQPVNGFTDNSGNGVQVYFLTDVALGINTFKGFGLSWDLSGSGLYGTCFGVTAGIDPTLFCGRAGGNLTPPGGIANFFFGNYYNADNRNHCFISSGAAGLIPSADNQFAVSYSAGYGFGGLPRANFSIRAGDTGDMLFSAVGEVADGTMANNEINPMIEVNDVVVLKTKNNSAGLNRTTLGMLAEPILHTSSGAILLINRRHNININSLNTCAFGGFLRRGDQCQVVILGTGETKIGTFGSQAVKFLGIDVTSANYICSGSQYASLLVEWTENDTITVKEATGTWLVRDGFSGAILASQNVLGNDPTLIGNALTTGRTKTVGSTKTGYQVLYQSIMSPSYTTTTPILPGDLFGGNVVLDPASPLVDFPMPSAPSLDTTLNAIFGSVAISDTFDAVIVNISATNAATVSSSADIVIVNGTITVPALGRVEVRVRRNTNSPAYTVI